jgi:2,4-dienoyl-CoA reductase (NADPH2)
MIGGRKPFSASAVRSRLTGETPRALELDEIPEVQRRFADAALRAKRAGFDAVEILGSAGYLISQFLSPITNLRKDRYGGSLENRMRFGLEVVEKVRNAVGSDYPIIIRIAGNEFMEGGNTNREARIFASELEKVGVDLFNVTGGWHETRIPQLSSFVPRKGFVYLAQGIRSAVSRPVLSSNRINDPAIGEEIIRNGEADLVTMARALLADPELPRKAMEGKEDQIYHCIACNQGCFDHIFRFRPATCTVNPRAGKEAKIKIQKTLNKKRILVIGGGLAGMKAACTSAQRGHEVILVEKDHQLGGQFMLNKAIPGRGELITAVRDLEKNLRVLGVKIVMGRRADNQFVKDISPDAVIIATGAKPYLPQLPGINRENVSSAWDVLKGKVRLGKRTVIIGGNAVGLETALYVAHQGTISPEALHFIVANRAESWETIEELVNRGNKDVTVIEMTSKVGSDIGASTRWTVMAEIRRLGVKILTSTRAVEIKDQGVVVERDGKEELIEADSVIMATGARASNELQHKVMDFVKEVHVIGDAKEPRNALEAIREGFFTGLEI